MSAPPATEKRGTPETSAVEFLNDLFDSRTGELGAETEPERARLCGVDRSTLYRYRTGRTVPLLPEGMRFAGSIGLTVADLWRKKRGA